MKEQMNENNEAFNDIVAPVSKKYMLYTLFLGSPQYQTLVVVVPMALNHVS